MVASWRRAFTAGIILVSPLLVIVGETASGKSALAIELAKKFNGEIIAADSRTVYRGMDIGTAKPSKAEQANIPHHLLDIVSPAEKFSAADFKRLANKAIEDISNRGKLPILAGGTGLYIDAVIFDFQFRPAGSPALREELSKFSVEKLQERLKEQGIPLPENKQNPRHLIRTLETKGELTKRKPLRKDTLVIGLKIDREMLKQRIRQRVDAMVAAGFVDEVRRLGEAYGWDSEALQTPGYKAFRGYITGELSLDQAKEQFITYDLQLAKHQRTWFKRNESIHWVEKQSEVVDLITTFLNK